MAGVLDVDVNYLDQLALRIRRQVSPSDLPDEEAVLLFRMYAVLLLAKGAAVSQADVHNAWVAWMLARDPEHEALVPYEKLDSEVAAMDRPFVDAIRLVATEVAP